MSLQPNSETSETIPNPCGRLWIELSQDLEMRLLPSAFGHEHQNACCDQIECRWLRYGNGCDEAVLNAVQAGDADKAGDRVMAELDVGML